MEIIKHSRKIFFTLVELLVVISIMIILVSILMPALSKAKARVLSVKCMNNLKQIGLGARFYLDENNDNFPIVGPWGGQVSPNARWDASLGSHFGGVVWPNVSARKFFICPSAPASESAAIPNHYIYNQEVPTYRVSRIKIPSKLVVIADGYNETELFKGAADWHVTLVEKLAIFIPKRHSMGLNYLFVDGHVAWHKNTSEINVGN